MLKPPIAACICLCALCVAIIGPVIAQQPHSPTTNAYYVALGSSFAAGFGLGPPVPGSPAVSRRSSNGYPQQLARLLQVTSFTDMTSSGSTMAQVLHGGQEGLGPQVDALGPDTMLVTLTAGGNDIHYVGDLMKMAERQPGSGDGQPTHSLPSDVVRPATVQELAVLRTTFDETLHEIARRSPKARIVVVTYPLILPRTGTCLRLGLTDDEVDAMRTVGDRLAQVTRAAALAANATVVDMATLSAGHDACAVMPWVNGHNPKVGAPFHPTLAGAKATANAVAQAIQ